MGRLALFVIFLGATFLLLRFTFLGSFKLILPVRSPINAESIIGVSFLLLLLLPRSKPAAGNATQSQTADSVLIVSLAAAAVLPFLLTIDAPLLHDSYTHVAEAASESWHHALAFLRHPSGSDLFFRPFGYIAYWLEFKWAAYSSLQWHICSLAIHTVNSCLVYVFARQLVLNRFSAFIAGLVFAIHGSRPEAVTWVAAQFDLFAAFFVLLSLIALNRYLETEQSLWFLFMSSSAVLAVLSKESAYCLPALALGLLPFKDRRYRRRLLQAAAALLAICSVIFAYRYYVIAGLGGYQSANGRSAVLQFHLVQTLKGLLFRQWSFQFFPINWSVDLGVWVKLSVVVMLAVMLGAVICSGARRDLLIGSILLLLIADLPVQHLLLLGADLTGARILYLPVLGLALFWGILTAACDRRSIRLLLTTGLILFLLVALCHNLIIWRQAAILSRKTCLAVGAELAHDPRPITIPDLPSTWHGVFFLRNGFLPCVAFNSHQRTDRILLDERIAAGSPRVFNWSETREQLEEEHSENNK